MTQDFGFKIFLYQVIQYQKTFLDLDGTHVILAGNSVSKIFIALNSHNDFCIAQLYVCDVIVPKASDMIVVQEKIEELYQSFSIRGFLETPGKTKKTSTLLLITIVY